MKLIFNGIRQWLRKMGCNYVIEEDIDEDFTALNHTKINEARNWSSAGKCVYNFPEYDHDEHCIYVATDYCHVKTQYTRLFVHGFDDYERKEIASAAGAEAAAAHSDSDIDMEGIDLMVPRRPLATPSMTDTEMRAATPTYMIATSTTATETEHRRAERTRTTTTTASSSVAQSASESSVRGPDRARPEKRLLASHVDLTMSSDDEVLSDSMHTPCRPPTRAMDTGLPFTKRLRVDRFKSLQNLSCVGSLRSHKLLDVVDNELRAKEKKLQEWEETLKKKREALKARKREREEQQKWKKELKERQRRQK